GRPRLEVDGRLRRAAARREEPLGHLPDDPDRRGGRQRRGRGLRPGGRGGVCAALLLEEKSRADPYPPIRIGEDDVNVGHEASVSKIGEEQLFYLMARGIPEDEAAKLIVNGFIEAIVKELPMEYAVEMNRLIELQMEGSIGGPGGGGR